MPISANQIFHVVTKEKVSPICASCSHFWEARQKGAPTCGQECSGPINGNDFPMYKGPMTTFETHCFACFRKADFAVRNPGKKIIGVCKEHLGHLDRLVSNAPHLEVVGPKGLVTPVEGRYTPKNLGEVMAETEEEWASQRGDS